MSLNLSNSIVNEYLMKLIYSDKSKENIQKEIESYLICQQNNIILDQISDPSLNYKLLNFSVSNILSDSKLDLQKLYNHYISTTYFKGDSISGFSIKNILTKVGFDYIKHILRDTQSNIELRRFTLLFILIFLILKNGETDFMVLPILELASIGISFSDHLKNE